jgi:hypothetical protein
MRTPRSSRATTESSSSSSLILRHPAPASRSFVLASLRALHLDPVALMTRACEYEDHEQFKQSKANNHLTRPHSFRVPLCSTRAGVLPHDERDPQPIVGTVRPRRVGVPTLGAASATVSGVANLGH